MRDEDFALAVSIQCPTFSRPRVLDPRGARPLHMTSMVRAMDPYP
jgi:hypothetical protein